MNKLISHKFKEPHTKFWPTFVSVEGVSPDGAPYTFAVIYRNKHERSNMMRSIGRYGAFMAGSKSQKAVEKYALHVDPESDNQVFINNGVVRNLEERGPPNIPVPCFLWYCDEEPLGRIIGHGSNSEDAFSSLDSSMRARIAGGCEFCVKLTDPRDIIAPYLELLRLYRLQQRSTQ